MTQDDAFLDVPSNPELDAEFDHLNWMFDGYVSLSTATRDGFRNLSGNESFYCLHFDVGQVAGTEAKLSDSIKEVAQRLYSNITDMLKRISTYFFGDAQKNANDAAEKAESAIAALNEMEGNTPIPDDSPLRNPDNIIKALEGGAEYNEIKDENRDLGGAMDKIRTAAEKVKGCDTVAKLRTVYAEIQSSSNQGLQSVGGSLRKVLSNAQQAANKLRNLKAPEEDDTPEVKAGIKEENKDASDEAKDETKKARIIGGMQNKIVGALNAVSKMAKTVKEKPAKSNFKG
jgi:hypothetical protein